MLPLPVHGVRFRKNRYARPLWYRDNQTTKALRAEVKDQFPFFLVAYPLSLKKNRYVSSNLESRQ